jgi:hypothetical protein
MNIIGPLIYQNEKKILSRKAVKKRFFTQAGFYYYPNQLITQTVLNVIGCVAHLIK